MRIRKDFYPDGKVKVYCCSKIRTHSHEMDLSDSRINSALKKNNPRGGNERVQRQRNKCQLAASLGENSYDSQKVYNIARPVRDKMDQKRLNNKEEWEIQRDAADHWLRRMAGYQKRYRPSDNRTRKCHLAWSSRFLLDCKNSRFTGI